MKKTFTLLFSAIFVSAFTLSNSSAQITSLQAIKNLYQGSTVTLPSAKINGVVISDTTNLNVSKGNTIVQSGGVGVTLYLGSYYYYNIGDSISLDVTGWTLQNYDSALEVASPKGTVLPPPVARGVTVVPQVVTISQLTSNMATLGYTLVEIEDATATTTAGVFNGAQTLADSTGSVELYTKKTALFANATPPATAANWIGFAEQYLTTPEFLIRNQNDILPYSPLPLKFESFTAEAKGLIANLTWSTANEVNISKFIIEKSFDGNTFSAIGTTAAKGAASNTYTYSYTEATNKIGTTAYYRLKSINKDGTFIYSNIEKVVFALGNKLSVYPNPADATTKLTYAANQHDVVANIISIDGKVVKQLVLKAGTTATEITVAGLAKGVYYIEAATNGKETVSFFKK